MTMKGMMAALAVAGGTMLGAGTVSAAPVPAATLDRPSVGVEQAQFYGPGYGYYGRPAYGYGPGFYRRRFGPPVVCRFRPTPFGPRRVCFRRY